VSHFVHSRPTARVCHICCMCGRRIDPGETYHRTAGMDGSAAWTWKECAHCGVTASYVSQDWGLDEYDDDLLSEFGRQGGESVAELRVAVQYRRRWHDTHGNLYPVPIILTEPHVTAGGFSCTRTLGIRPGEAS
jgi:hypothetical protein